MKWCLLPLLLVAGCAKGANGSSSSEATSPTGNNALAAGDHEIELEVDGRSRRYLVHVPPAASRPAQTPVVLGLHGGGGSAEGTRRAYALDPVADRKGFIAVYPEGVGDKKLGKTFAKWNVGACCQEPDGPDDVAFINAVVDDLAQRISIDPKRVYAAGLSNGSMMARELACKASDRYAAVVGTGALDGEACRPPRAVPTLYVAGKLDPCIPYGGGTCGGCFQRALQDMGIPIRKIPEFTCPKIEDGIASLASTHGCSDQTRVTYSRAGATCRAYQGCRAEVEFCVDPALGHHWPGTPALPVCERKPDGKLCRAYMDNTGPRSDSIDLASMSWAFFERFSLP